MDNLSESDFLILDPYKAQKRNMSTRLLLRGDHDVRFYKSAKIKGYAICIYTNTSKYTSNIIKSVKEF